MWRWTAEKTDGGVDRSKLFRHTGLSVKFSLVLSETYCKSAASLLKATFQLNPCIYYTVFQASNSVRNTKRQIWFIYTKARWTIWYSWIWSESNEAQKHFLIFLQTTSLSFLFFLTEKDWSNWITLK